ncbi:MAG TPA: ferritin-like domain-containing protein [Acidimicrobiales bacterium]|nr:ferritin-like domain-containing protein [Acidimicrobiales bacterium]
MPDKPDPMDLDAVLERLNAALELEQRSVLELVLTAGSVVGFEYHAVSSLLAEYALAELADVRRLVEKIVALGGRPSTTVARPELAEDPATAIDVLIDHEGEALTALHAVIPPTGQEPGSEALEHLIEQVIMRKQEQVDSLLRARGKP